MKVKALRSMVGSYGRMARGEVRDLPKHHAEALLKKGRVVQVGGKEAAGKASGNPSKRKPRTGGRTGKAKTSSSSPAGQAPAGKTSTAPTAGSGASASTKDGA